MLPPEGFETLKRELASLKFVDGLAAHLKDVREPHKALRHALRDTLEFFQGTHGRIATLHPAAARRSALHAAQAHQLDLDGGARTHPCSAT
jgi:hypothetical protein